jgi:hypothetical protein
MRQFIHKSAGIIALVVLGCCCFLTVSASADGLDAACRQAQLSVQAQVGDEDPGVYKNHGAYVSAAAAAANVFLYAGEIDSVCHSCIVSQFARRIPISDQEPCGPDSPNPECEGATCATFVPCNVPNSCNQPVCATTPEGGVCLEGTTPCAGLIPCPNGTSDCPAGSVCAINTCCGINVCIPPEAFCAPGSAPAPANALPPGTLTIAGPSN